MKQMESEKQTKNEKQTKGEKRMEDEKQAARRGGINDIMIT